MCFRCSYSGIWDTIVGAWRSFCHHLFLLHTGVGLCVEKKIICGVTQAGCGPANPILNLLRWTPPLAASTSVNGPCSICPFTFGFDPGSVLHIPLPSTSLQHGTWRMKWQSVTLNTVSYCFNHMNWSLLLWGVLQSRRLYCTVGVFMVWYSDSGVDSQCSPYFIPFATVQRCLHDPHLKYPISSDIPK